MVTLEQIQQRLIETINLKALQWIWLTRAIGKPGSLQAVKEAALAVSFFLKSTNLSEDKNITEYLFMADKLAAFAKNVSLGGIPFYSTDITANYVYFNIRAYNFYASNKDLIMKLLSEITGKR